MNFLTVRNWCIEEWLRSESIWSELLSKSGGDPLFMSWEWQTHWWQCYGRNLGHAPQILAFYRGVNLVGVAPLYRRFAIRSRLLLMRSVQMIGLSWRDPEPPISEYLDVIALPPEQGAVRRACIGFLLEDPRWTELVIGFTAEGKHWRDAFVESLPAATKHYVRDLDRSCSYQADLSSGFPAYLRDLGQSTRRSVWNLRGRLAKQGQMRFEYVAYTEIEAGFNELNRLHRLRWDKPAFTGERLSFHLKLAQLLARRGELSLSRLRVGGEVVSVLYDICKDKRQYNIKMGFDPTFNRRVSLGLIHLGYAMEAAADRNVAVYNFLAGVGKRSDYKSHLSQARRELSCVQILRGRALPTIYRWRDRTRRTLNANGENARAHIR